MKKFITLAAALALIMTLLSGCTDGGNASTSSDGMIDETTTGATIGSTPRETQNTDSTDGTNGETASEHTRGTESASERDTEGGMNGTETTDDDTPAAGARRGGVPRF